MNHHLISLYKERLNLHNATFSGIEHDDAMIAIVFRVRQPDGSQSILKISPRPNDYRRELHFLRAFAGKLPVPHILQTIEPEEEIYGAILMECFPGAPLNSADYSTELAYQIGSILAQIHQYRAPGYGDLTFPNELSPDPRVHFAFKFEEGLEECGNHLPKAWIDQFRKDFTSHLDLLLAADGPSLIHRDFRPANVIVHQGKLQGIIDWASGRASFAQDDFCPFENGEWSTDTGKKRAFLEGYASVRPVPQYAAMMPLLRLSRAVATVGFTFKQRTWETTHARVYQANRRILESFFQNPLGSIP